MLFCSGAFGAAISAEAIVLVGVFRFAIRAGLRRRTCVMRNSAAAVWAVQLLFHQLAAAADAKPVFRQSIPSLYVYLGQANSA